MKWFRQVLAVAALACAGAAVYAPAASAQQQARIAVIVGNNIGHDAKRALRYAEREVGRLGQVLRASGDFQAVRLLQGATRDDVEQALKAARGQLEQARASGKSTLFLFYYSGHGNNEALELGSTRLPLRDLRFYLEQLRAADVRLAFVDACQSGALTGVKGGRRAPAYDVRLADPGSVKGLAIVTSSTANELAQESDDLQASYFGANIMAGLQGLADSSGDGQVTLRELYDFTYKRTLASTAATLVGGQHATFDTRLAGAGDVVLTRTRTHDAQVRFPREAGAVYTVFHQERGEVVAELASSPNEDLYLAVPAGKYRVVRRALASVSERALTLSAGSASAIDPASMAPVAMLAQNNLRKKGGRLEADNAVGAHVGLQMPVVPGAAGVVRAVGLSYARELPWLSLRLRGDMASFTGQHAMSEESKNLRAGLSLDLLWPAFDAGAAALLVGPSIGASLVQQKFQGFAASWSLGPVYGGVVSFGVRAGRATWLTLTGFAGAELFKLNEGDRHRNEHKPTASLSLGGTFAF